MLGVLNKLASDIVLAYFFQLHDLEPNFKFSYFFHAAHFSRNVRL